MGDIIVSVIVPCYNQADYLAEALQSVSYQTYYSWECIIINDGSTDHTGEIAGEWCKADSRFTYLQIENGGLSNARNTGILRAKGKFILPLDADDVLHKKFLELAVKKIISDNTIKAVSSFVRFFGAENSEHKTYGGSVRDFLHYNRTVATSLFLKEDFLEIGGYDNLMKNGYEDWEFWIRLLKNGGYVAIIPDYLFYYRKKAASMLKDADKLHVEIYSYIIGKHIDVFREHLVHLLLLKDEIIRNSERRQSASGVKKSGRIGVRFVKAILRQFK